MFFSVIVPTYNPKKWLPDLLKSIQASYCSRGDIEIILSDDCSDEPFENILHNFKNLDIKVIHNDKHYGFPRWGRQHGIEVAQGDWVCFCDQDDIFLDNAFDQMKSIIEKNNLHNYLVTNFYMRHEQQPGQDPIEDTPMVQTLNWTHGKFYERKFLVDNDIHYDNVRYCEDINFSSHVDLALRLNELDIVFVDIFTYVWNQRSTSLSKNNNYKDYFYKSFPEYIDGTIGVYIDSYEQHPNASEELAEYFKIRIEQTFMYYFFYFQGMMNPIHDCPPIPDSYYKQISDYFVRYRGCIKMSTEEYIDYTYATRVDLYGETRNTANSQITFIEYESYGDWIRKLTTYENHD